MPYGTYPDSGKAPWGRVQREGTQISLSSMFTLCMSPKGTCRCGKYGESSHLQVYKGYRNNGSLETQRINIYGTYDTQKRVSVQKSLFPGNSSHFSEVSPELSV